MPLLTRRRALGSAVVLSLVSVIGATKHIEAANRSVVRAKPIPADPMFVNPAAIARFADDSLRGRSGKLLVRFISPSRVSRARSAFAAVFGDSSLAQPGIYELRDSALSRPFAFVAMTAFGAKRDGYLGAYNIGRWPGESRVTSPAYANPDGFIEVTPENASMKISEHFRLRDFLTHDQADVWPKYLVLREELVDKLELVIAELEAEGHHVKYMAVMSGFRTPQYNAHGGETAGRAELSRHMYGDASDVYVDNNADEKMDDLNGDGRIDYRDAQVVLAAEEAVERAHPDLLGGGGVYKAAPGHGPFTHIDVRGNRARWGLLK